MTAVVSATPLIALDAVVIDTETTGLDPARARIIEIGALRIAGGKLSNDRFRSLLNPDVPIPDAVSAIVGIRDADVAGAPSFREVWPKFRDFVSDSAVIGHSLGFDVAVIGHECARLGEGYAPRRTLDTRLLAQVVAPNLASYTIESLCAWLGVEAARRHSALGDAETTARIFQALVPRLRGGGIRTLAEAMNVCRTLTDVLDQQHRAGWAEAGTASRSDAERTLARIDAYPYRHRVRDVMSRSPKFIAAGRPLSDALALMMKDKVSSLYVREESADETAIRAADTGIVTERNALRALAARGAAALAAPVREFMSRPLATVPADAFVYRAIGRMTRLKFRHLGVVDEAGLVVGALSARDLLRLRATEAVSLGDEIDQAADVHELAAAWAKLPEVAASLHAEELSGRDVAAVISRELGALTRAAAVIAERWMREAGRGEPPCPFAVAVLGSAGRGESLLAMDQDNALIFAEGAPDSLADLWFAEFGAHLAGILHAAGVPYCTGGVMAKNPQWRGSVQTWRARIKHWISRTRPQDLLAVDIFFDLRGVHGEKSLAERLLQDSFDEARGQAGFAKALVEAIGPLQSAVGLFGGIKTDQGRTDLKKRGLFAIVTSARALAICHHVNERETPARLMGVKALGIGGDQDLDALAEAQGVFLDLILAQQIADIEHGIPASNSVVLKSLTTRDRERLRTALKAAETIDDLTRDLLFRG